MEEIGDADTAIATEAGRWLSQTAKTFGTGIDVGCGPVLEYPFVFAPHVQQYDLADYLPANLQNIKLWQTEQEGAHDWSPLFRGILRTQELDPEVHLENRANKLRTAIHKLRNIDLFQASPLGEPVQYDLVTSFFCTECVGCNTTDWRLLKSRLIDLFAPGGSFFSELCLGAPSIRSWGNGSLRIRCSPTSSRLYFKILEWTPHFPFTPAPSFANQDSTKSSSLAEPRFRLRYQRILPGKRGMLRSQKINSLFFGLYVRIARY